MPNYYEILKVGSDADQEMIKAAYRTLMFRCRCHPDLGGDKEYAQLLGEAYQALIDPKSRQKYNETIGAPVPAPDQRRRVIRIETNLMITYHKSESDEVLPARLADISYLGCRLQSQGMIPKDEMIAIEIGGHTIQGWVRWNRMFHPNNFTRIYEAGVEFLKGFDEIDKILPLMNES